MLLITRCTSVVHSKLMTRKKGVHWGTKYRRNKNIHLISANNIFTYIINMLLLPTESFKYFFFQCTVEELQGNTIFEEFNS